MDEEKEKERRRRACLSSQKYYREHRDEIIAKNLERFKANRSEFLARRRELRRFKTINDTREVVFHGPSVVRFD